MKYGNALRELEYIEERDIEVPPEQKKRKSLGAEQPQQEEKDEAKSPSNMFLQGLLGMLVLGVLAIGASTAWDYYLSLSDPVVDPVPVHRPSQAVWKCAGGEFSSFKKDNTCVPVEAKVLREKR